MSVKFGLFSDLHYSLKGTEERGNSRRTFEDMKKGMARFAAEKADFAVSLGDNAQPAVNRSQQYDQIKAMVTEWNSYGLPVHAAFGNHEFSQLSLQDILEIWQTDRTYYSFVIRDIRFVVLDTSFTPEGIHYSEDNFDWRFGILPDKEISWLEKLLSENKRTIIFTHNNLYYNHEDEYSDWLKLVNHKEVVDVLEKSGCVEAVFQGHHHIFNKCMKGSITFVNISSPERSPAFTESDFPIVEIKEDGILYNGVPLEMLE